jgi:DNA-binding NarL/FixJ family response regulator
VVDSGAHRRGREGDRQGFIPKSASIDTIAESLRTVLDGGISAPRLLERRTNAERRRPFSPSA